TLLSSEDAEWVTLYVNEMVNFHLNQAMSGFVKIHAACGSLGGKRFLLAGEKGAGKTTLISRLLFEDAAVHGDEKVLVRDREVIPLPRKFHLKEGTIRLIPQLQAVWDKLTSYPTSYGLRVCFFDPWDAGLGWQTQWREVDTIFYLEPNHGQPTEVETCPKWLMSQKVIMQSLHFDTNPEPQIARLCGIVGESDCFILRIGELDAAVNTLKEILL
ncbi:MAG: hypothetical protein R6U38_04030, partial [Desulfatiglandaceae bacterium]